MEKVDLRKLESAALHEKKQQVIRLKQKGYKGKEIEELTLVSENQISRIWRAFCKGGAKAIKPKKRGRKEGEQKLLSAEQEREVRKIIIDKTPDQVKLSFMLWTRQAISELVMQLYGIDLSLRCITNYLRRWGLILIRIKSHSIFSHNASRFCRAQLPSIQWI